MHLIKEIDKQIKQEIDKQIKQYSIELINLKENRTREFDTLSDAENNDYDHQIQLTARIICGLKHIQDIASLNISDKNQN